MATWHNKEEGESIQIVNQGRIEAQYHLENAVIKKTYYTNPAVTYMLKHRLHVENAMNREQTYLYDTVRLSIYIKNTSAMLISNIRVSNILPEGALYVKNSARVNGTIQWGVNMVKEACFSELEPQEILLLEFEAVISEQYKESVFSYQTEVMYDYQYDITKEPISATMEKSSVQIPVELIFLKEEEPVHPYLYYNYRAMRLVEICETKAEPACVKVIQSGADYMVLVIGIVKYQLNIYQQRCVQKRCCNFGVTSLLPVKPGIRLCLAPQARLQVKGVTLRISENNQMLLCPKISVQLSKRQ